MPHTSPSSLTDSATVSHGVPHTPHPHHSTVEATVTTRGITASTTVTTTESVAPARGVPAGQGEGVDPLMVKYMELVRQRRAEEREEESGGKGSQQSPTSQSEHSHVSRGVMTS